MKGILSFIKTTLVGGLFYIIPLVLLIYLILMIVDIFRDIIAPISNKIDVSLFGGETTSRIIATLLLLLLCFIAGLFAKSKKKSPIKDWVEDNILSNIPGYTLLKGMTDTAAGFNSENLKEAVLINVEEVWQIGFLMERIDDDINVVFIPSAPNPMAGDVVLVKKDRLKILNIDEISVIKIYRKLGIDSKKILGDKINISTFE